MLNYFFYISSYKFLMRFSQFFETGPTRIPIDSSYYLGGIVALLFSQTLLAAVEPKYLSTSMKRVIATPLILVDIVFPMIYRDASESMMSVLSTDHNDLFFKINSYYFRFFGNSLEFTWCDHSFHGISPLFGSVLGCSCCAR